MTNNNNKKRGFPVYWIYAIAAIAFILIQLYYGKETKINAEKQLLYTLVDSSGVEKITAINKEKAYFTLNDKGVALVTSSKDPRFSSIQKELKKEDKASVKKKTFEVKDVGDYGNFEQEIQKRKFTNYSNDTEIDYLGTVLSYLLPFGIILLIWFFVMRRISGGGGGSGGGGSQIFNIGKSKAQLYEKGKSTNVTFKDVAGLEGAKEEIVEIVEFLKNPKKYTDIGAKIPKGALLVGPPGTGKTLLAKAVAGEAKVPFFSLSGSDFVEMFVGVGASRVRDLFRQAKEKSPAIIFIDEIDAIGRARGKNNGFNSNDERENT